MATRRNIHVSPTAVDVVIFTIENDQLKVLLIKRTNEPYKSFWALPGAFMKKSEPSYKTAARTLKEKAGIHSVYLEQLYTFDASGMDPRGSIISVAYFALSPRQKIKLGAGKDVQTPTFFAVKKLPTLGFAHKNIVSYAVKRLAAKLEYTNAVYSLLPKHFTLHQLQKAYETILNRKLDKRNFRKKFLSLKLIKATKKVLTGAHQRPARLYVFVSQKPSVLKKFF